MTTPSFQCHFLQGVLLLFLLTHGDGHAGPFSKKSKLIVEYALYARGGFEGVTFSMTKRAYVIVYDR